MPLLEQPARPENPFHGNLLGCSCSSGLRAACCSLNCRNSLGCRHADALALGEAYKDKLKSLVALRNRARESLLPRCQCVANIITNPATIPPKSSHAALIL